MYLYLKKIMDIALSVILLIIMSPLFLIISIFIKSDSPGPVLFVHQRLGKNKKLFKIYKFRTMYKESPENLATRHFDNAESYITKVGSFLRRTSLDELPQLVNIFLGEMTFVGPRPIIPEEVDLIEAREKYNVYDCLPGITGWAQINGRDLVKPEKKAMLDGKYVQNINIFTDIKIILLTIITIIKRDGFFEGPRE